MWALLAQIPNLNQLWFAIPLIVSVSLVYGATRHEHLPEIFYNAYRAAIWILGFMAIIFAVLFVLSWFV
jgi:hypothetical protein